MRDLFVVAIRALPGLCIAILLIVAQDRGLTRRMSGLLLFSILLLAIASSIGAALTSKPFRDFVGVLFGAVVLGGTTGALFAAATWALFTGRLDPPVQKVEQTEDRRLGVADPIAPQPTVEKRIARPDPPKTVQGFREKAPETISFSLGGGLTVTNPVSSLIDNAPASIQFNDFDVAYFRYKDGAVWCDVSLWGGEGAAPVEVKRNEFVVRPPGWDRNSSPNALEVVDDRGGIVFQMIRKTPSHYVVMGKFRVPLGMLVVTDKMAVLNPSSESAGPLHPIFKYPSWKYPGKYVDDPSRP